MSKRFGRQQKRRMRAEIEALEASNQWLGGTVTLKERQLSQYQETIDLIRETFGPNWFGLTPKSMEVKPERWRQQIHSPPYVDVSSMFADNLGEELAMIRHNIMDKVDSEVFKDQRGAVHVELTWRGNRYAYAATEEAMFQLPVPILAQHIMHSLCDYTAKEIHKALGVDREAR